MLTKKELLKYKKQKDKIVPIFIDPKCESLQEFAVALCDLFENSLGKTRKQIEEEANELISAFDVENITALGFKKLCFDLLTFESILSTESSEFRENVFAASFKVLSTVPSRGEPFGETAGTMEAYRYAVIQAVNASFEALSFSGLTREFSMSLDSPVSPCGYTGNHMLEKVESYLYSDLPEFHKLTELKPITPLQLLHKYNVSLVQGFLFYCSSLKICVPASIQYKAHLRQLIKQIKFFQLVAFFTKKENSLEIEIDGPLSLFVHTHKYGFNLACFFPALLFMPQWEIMAFIEMGKEPRKSGVLQLSEKTGLLSHYKNYSAYIPEEFKLFFDSFAQLPACPWRITENCEEILFDGDNTFFPDFEFSHDDGTRVYLELFHPWHAAAIKHRLKAFAKKKPDFKLILGIAKPLLKDGNFAEEVQQSDYYSSFSFIFRDVLLPEKVLEALNKFSKKVTNKF